MAIRSPLGARVVQKDLAHTLRLLVEAESGATSREAGIRAARDRFYTGDIAERMVRFTREQGGWLTMQDLAEFHVAVEEPVKTTYRGYEVYACGPWCQGPVVPQTLNILEQYDLASQDRFSAEVYHLILEALKASFADRDRYYGDPRFVDVPIDGLLSKAYAKQWQERIDLCTGHPGHARAGRRLGLFSAPGALSRAAGSTPIPVRGRSNPIRATSVSSTAGAMPSPPPRAMA